MSLPKGLQTGQTAAQGIAKLLREQREAKSQPAPLVRGYCLSLRLTLPSRTLSPNGRAHWAVKARAVKAQREEAYLAAMDAGAGCFKRPIISAHAFCPRGGRRDRDNLIASCKGAIDGLTDAGLWNDDSEVRWGAVEFSVDKADPRLILFVSECEP